ncbi:hypothetical protein RGQ29_015813 [Quercus rubra]|uniref:RRN7-type domain-containing protein n=1 Tax=Quercus rubra TaxID=3512 RepID=A0AAN7FWA1_QUERU|nr:hypothetical protein RGQ29_015813 [Quercus rubra]
MAEPKNWACQACGFVGLSDGSDGYFYCDRCGAQTEDLPTYLQYCKDVVFAVLEPLFEDHDEKLIEEFWDFYQNEKDSEPAEDFEEGHHALTRRD